MQLIGRVHQHDNFKTRTSFQGAGNAIGSVAQFIGNRQDPLPHVIADIALVLRARMTVYTETPVRAAMSFSPAIFVSLLYMSTLAYDRPQRKRSRKK
ncbi:hypothetical protein CSA56_05295 [candidate division KSB3 bacterium]|uniref:Uncharacterized protein n=1 Tax=candidate division KSB3 bacterium TaxID=2044937 RepID=A0A2G6KHL2_9BACT|nr:MAG: hypothetical protein CSA56_05295 [candidate division KSB3 bacterium]